jgi:dipeptidase D
MEENKKVIQNLKPEKLWSYFAELTQIPRPSMKEEGVRTWIRKFADERNLKYKEDEAGNLVVFKNAQNSSSQKVLLLQAHMDMVCEKKPEVQKDFDKEGIDLRLDGDYIYAQGTTLGADNGMGLCTILCILDDKNISHPPLQALFTVNEETGMTGVMALDQAMISADYMLNLDTEEEGSVYIGCAGSRDTNIKFEYAKTVLDSNLAQYKLEIGGLRGGHSGVQIHENRVNAIKLIGQLLFDITSSHDIQLIEINGGNKRNAIPRDCTVKFAVKKDESKDVLEKLNQKIKDAIENYKNIETEISIDLIEENNVETTAFKPEDSNYILNIINAIHSGVYRMSSDVPGLVETSNNLGVIKTDDNTVEITCMTRSSDQFELNNAFRQILSSLGLYLNEEKDLFEAKPIEIIREQGTDRITINLSKVSVVWKPEPKSELLDIFQNAHENLFGKKAEVKAVHAGLECGTIRQYLPKCQIISFGPQIDDAHSPNEHVKVSSVEKFYELTVSVISQIS